MLSSLLFTLFLIGSATADGYKCAGNYLINPPDPNDLSKPYYYPEGWNEAMQPAKYEGSQMCNWQINVLEGMYATVTFYKNTDSESGITCVYPNMREEYIEDKDHNPYIFTYPQFQVNLRVSDKQGEFSFKVVWSKYPGACKIDVKLSDAGAISSVPNNCLTTYNAPNKAMLVGFSLKDDDSAPILRQSAVYEGDSTNGKYLGNLYYARYQQIVSDSKQLTVYTFGLEKVIDYTLYMGMDKKAAGDIQQFTGLNCPSDTSIPCYITLNAIYNISAVATLSRQPDFLKQFRQFPFGATLKIYEEKISDDHLLATINHSNYLTQFPLAVKNSLKIYHLDTGRLEIPVTKDPVNADWTTVYDGRYVNIHSLDYRGTSFDQDTFENFTTENANEKLYFKFNVKYFDVNGPTTLDIKITRDGNIMYSESFTGSKLPPPYPIKVLGDKMTVNYQTYGNYTRGFEVDLLTTKNDDVTSLPSSPFSTFITTPISTQTKSTVPSKSSPITTKSVSKPFVTTPTVSDSPSTDSPNPNGETTTTVQALPGSSTTIGSITRGTTQRYETTTKSGMTQFSCISFLLIAVSLFL